MPAAQSEQAAAPRQLWQTFCSALVSMLPLPMLRISQRKTALRKAVEAQAGVCFLQRETNLEYQYIRPAVGTK